MKRIRVFLLSFLLSSLLIGCSGDSGKPAEYSLAWKDQEKAVYNLSVNDSVISEVVFTIERTDDSVYKVDSYTEVQGGVTNSGAFVDTSSFLPLSTYYIQKPPPEATRKETEIKGEYQEDVLKLNINSEGKVQEKEVKLPKNIVDNESVLMMVRNLALEEDFQQSINIVIPVSAQVAPYSIKVVAKELVEVPYGEFEAFKVMFRYTGKGSVPDMYAWYTADESKIMLKYVNQNAKFELIDYK
ncbi:DUF3108 domain-containing protein [Alkaliphilus serpentinus]|uniref:DUF3108 domain-containing protein n=1 Tax=Alkaliphilus serpentinus TaxID=1482731 RepID=A0A833HM86_9FIRM|nr:DUF3108 domain-containing protein [Alkaliphilus serpentinus]KAB3527262.1 DUF3108 domain-containing protein [Alkaliphilus serpentinus]